jgi:hypothetical protein
MKSMNTVALLPLVTLILIAAPFLRAAERMKSGQWEVSIAENGQAHTNTHCDTEDQVKGTNGSPEEIRASLDKSATHIHCTIKDFKMENDTISYTYVCPGRSTTSTTTYHGDTYESVVTSKVGGEEHTRQLKGRRLGACP